MLMDCQSLTIIAEGFLRFPETGQVYLSIQNINGTKVQVKIL